MEIRLDPNGGKHGPSALPYWTVSDIAASAKALIAVGGTVVQEIKNVGYGMLVASVKVPTARPWVTTISEVLRERFQ